LLNKEGAAREAQAGEGQDEGYTQASFVAVAVQIKLHQGGVPGHEL
jgi:hypothetical protein